MVTANGSSSSVPAAVGPGTHRQGWGTSESVSLAARQPVGITYPGTIQFRRHLRGAYTVVPSSACSSYLMATCAVLCAVSGAVSYRSITAWLHASHLLKIHHILQNTSAIQRTATDSRPLRFGIIQHKELIQRRPAGTVCVWRRWLCSDQTSLQVHPRSTSAPAMIAGRHVLCCLPVIRHIIWFNTGLGLLEGNSYSNSNSSHH